MNKWAVVSMTWSKTTTFTLTTTSTSELLSEFWTNHLGNIGAWEVSGDNARMYIGDRNAGDQEYFHFRRSTSSICTLCNTNGAADWTGATGSEGYNATIDSLSVVNTCDIWTSDQTSNSFMLFNNGALRWMWLDATEWDIYGDPFPDGVATNLIYEGSIRGFAGTGTYGVNGPPTAALGSSPYSQGRAIYANNHGLASMNSKPSRGNRVLQGFHFMAGTYTSFGYCNFSDVLSQSSAGSAQAPFNSTSTIVMYDGTDYYIRTNSNLSYGAFLLNCGPTEPII